MKISGLSLNGSYLKIKMYALKNLVGCGRAVNKHLNGLVAPILNRQLKFSTFPGGILNSGLPDIEIPKATVDEFVFENIAKWENHTAVVSFD